MTSRGKSGAPNAERLLARIAPILLLVAFFGKVTTPIWDIDFWWHASTGRAIVETGRIPDSDPLGIYQATDLRARVLLKAYWLSQVTFFAAHDWFGATGVVLLRSFALSLALALVMLRSRLLEAGPLWTITIGALVGLSALRFTGDRPALASFVGIAVMFLLIDHLGRRTVALVALPVLMLLWANCHGGATLGAALLGLVAVVLPLEWRLTRTRRMLF